MSVALKIQSAIDKLYGISGHVVFYHSEKIFEPVKDKFYRDPNLQKIWSSQNIPELYINLHMTFKSPKNIIPGMCRPYTNPHYVFDTNIPVSIENLHVICVLHDKSMTTVLK